MYVRWPQMLLKVLSAWQLNIQGISMLTLFSPCQGKKKKLKFLVLFDFFLENSHAKNIILEVLAFSFKANQIYETI